jgi:hypothetical protein
MLLSPINRVLLLTHNSNKTLSKGEPSTVLSLPTSSKVQLRTKPGKVLALPLRKLDKLPLRKLGKVLALPIRKLGKVPVQKARKVLSITTAEGTVL